MAGGKYFIYSDKSINVCPRCSGPNQSFWTQRGTSPGTFPSYFTATRRPRIPASPRNAMSTRTPTGSVRGRRWSCRPPHQGALGFLEDAIVNNTTTVEHSAPQATERGCSSRPLDTRGSTFGCTKGCRAPPSLTQHPLQLGTFHARPLRAISTPVCPVHTLVTHRFLLSSGHSRWVRPETLWHRPSRSAASRFPSAGIFINKTRFFLRSYNQTINSLLERFFWLALATC